MGKFEGIAILSDLDRTFFNMSGKVVERNLRAIEYFKSEGGRFSLATGRMHYNLDALVPNVEKLVNAPAILCNGTYLYDFPTGRVITESYMDCDVAYRAIEEVRMALPRTRVRVTFRDGYLIDSRDEKTYREITAQGITRITALPFEDWKPEKWFKFVVIGTEEDLNKAERILDERYPGQFEFNHSSPRALEMQKKGTNKSSLLGVFREYCAPKNVRVFACGDYENDRALLAAADVSVCPSNAHPAIREMCDYCFCSCDDGVIADLIEYLDKDS